MVNGIKMEDPRDNEWKGERLRRKRCRMNKKTLSKREGLYERLSVITRGR